MRIGMTFYRPRVALVCLVKIDGWFRAFDVFGIGREQLHGSGVAQLLPLAVDPSKIRAVRASRLAIFFDLNARVEQSGRLAVGGPRTVDTESGDDTTRQTPSKGV